MATRREYGTGKISFEKKTGRYRARLQHEGQTIACGTHPTREAAEVALASVRKRLTQDAIVVGGATLNDFAETWIKRREAEGKRDDESRWNSHVRDDMLGRKPVVAIHPADISAWVDRLANKRAKKGNGHKTLDARKLSRQTCQNALNMLRSCLERAKEIGIIQTNPAHGIKLPDRAIDKQAKVYDPWTWLSSDEQAQLLDAIETEEKHLVQFAIWTGLRKMELLALRAVDVHRDAPRPFIVVRHGSADGPTKGRSIRRVPLLPGAVDAWDCWEATMKPRIEETGLAFPSYRSNSPRTRPPRCFDATVQRLGVVGQTGAPVVWHSLRHTCASMLVSGGFGAAWSLEEIKGFMGHKHISTTERYAHLAETAVTRAADRVWDAAQKPSAPVIQLTARFTR